MIRLRAIFLAVSLIAACGTVPAFSDDTNKLIGGWSMTGADDRGQMLTRLLEIKENKFTLKIIGDDGKVAFQEEGDLKLEKFGPFDSIKFYNIKVAHSSLNTRSTDKERVAIYQLGDGTLTLASNFDTNRNQRACLDAYTKTAVAVSELPTLCIEKIVMHQTPRVGAWFVCFEAKTDGPRQRFHIPKQSFAKDGVTIQMDLKVPNVRLGQNCTFKCQLDDIEADVCADAIDTSSSGQFIISASGSQEFKPQDRWRYTLYWHLK